MDALIIMVLAFIGYIGSKIFALSEAAKTRIHIGEK